jgi:transposase
MGTISLGVDLAKCVFAVCEADAAGRVVRRREFKHDAFALHLAQLPAGTVVAMEACSGAHHWARRCLEYGLVPSQHSSGGHARLGAISCRGDGYLRTLLIQGARSSLERAKRVSLDKATPEQLWIRSLACRMPFGKVIVAIANKRARQLWAMLAHDLDYDPCASIKRPLQHKQLAA